MRSRQKVIDATLDLVAEGGFAAASIAAVASRAGVSRQTVYSIFGSREDMVSQAVISVTMEATDEIRSGVDAAEGPAEYLVEFVIAGRAVLHRHPVLATLLRGEALNPLFDTGMLSRARPVAREMLAPMAVRFPQIESRMDDIVEMALLIGLSVILFDDPADRPDDELRAFLTRWIAPSLD
ncbi:TetR/AcrR family transcriptional regulator [Williamsia sp. MIQD14]|uniref:TetR/AcrR family transcriptional regulator n=1 Tax=Williamsia sp. MIQD14 TaxID=3425703 RepID=UPI003DA039D1